MTRRVLVTGAAGDVGREVVRLLLRRGVAVRAAEPDLERMHIRDGDINREVDVAKLELRDRDSYPGALADCDGLFLCRPGGESAALQRFIDTALDNGVQHVVYLSVAGAGENPLTPQHAVERHLAAKKVSHTLLRPGFFFQSLGTVYRDDLVEDDRLYSPAGRARVAFVDGRDVAEVAVRVFEEPEPHCSQAYTLTGPEALSFEDAAKVLSVVLGRPIRYEVASVVDYARHLRRRGLSLAQIANDTLLHVGLRYGQAEKVDETLPRLLGRRATTLERYLRDHIHLWEPRSPRSTSEPPSEDAPSSFSTHLLSPLRRST